jgi:hypothetical protein
MTWMEEIHIRTTNTPRDRIVNELINQRPAMQDQEEPVTMRIFLHGVVDTDLCIHLHWLKKRFTPKGSAVGQKLAAGLRMVCQVKHTAWKEVPLHQGSA